MEPLQGKIGKGLKVTSFFKSNGNEVTPLLFESNLYTIDPK
jgi:hypothetical protein